MKKLLVMIFVGSALLFTACRSKKHMVDVPSAGSQAVSADAQKKAELISRISGAALDFRYLAAKARVSVDKDGKNTNISFNIRMKKDEKIWISVTALGGIEMARVLLDTGKVEILDRINNKYIRQDYEYISELLKNEVDFFLVQDLMLGNIPPRILAQPASVKTSADAIEMKGKYRDSDFKTVFSPATFRLISMLLEDTELKQSLAVSYGDYRSLDQQAFPFLINSLAGSEKESVKLEVQYTKVDKVESLEFPFSVPKKYD
jgi:hypothetical protein